jgi:hypothetical protein
MMAGTPTTNYQLPTYADTDAPDLTGAYNQAMKKIDAQMKANSDKAASATSAAGTAKSTADSALKTANRNEAEITKLAGSVANLEGGAFKPQDSDATLTVQQLSEAKVTKAGIVYFKPASQKGVNDGYGIHAELQS